MLHAARADRARGGANLDPRTLPRTTGLARGPKSKKRALGRTEPIGDRIIAVLEYATVMLRHEEVLRSEKSKVIHPGARSRSFVTRTRAVKAASSLLSLSDATEWVTTGTSSEAFCDAKTMLTGILWFGETSGFELPTSGEAPPNCGPQRFSSWGRAQAEEASKNDHARAPQRVFVKGSEASLKNRDLHADWNAVFGMASFAEPKLKNEGTSKALRVSARSSEYWLHAMRVCPMTYSLVPEGRNMHGSSKKLSSGYRFVAMGPEELARAILFRIEVTKAKSSRGHIPCRSLGSPDFEVTSFGKGGVGREAGPDGSEVERPRSHQSDSAMALSEDDSIYCAMVSADALVEAM